MVLTGLSISIFALISPSLLSIAIAPLSTYSVPSVIVTSDCPNKINFGASVSVSILLLASTITISRPLSTVVMSVSLRLTLFLCQKSVISLESSLDSSLIVCLNSLSNNVLSSKASSKAVAKAVSPLRIADLFNFFKLLAMAL